MTQKGEGKQRGKAKKRCGSSLLLHGSRMNGQRENRPAKSAIIHYFYGVRLAPYGATGEIANYTIHAVRSWYNKKSSQKKRVREMAFLPIGFLSAMLWVGIGMIGLVLIGTFILQIFLSKMKNPWAGLILPGFTFGFILLLCTMTPDFETAWLGLSRGNIPTAIYLLIYFLFRRKKKRSNPASQPNTKKNKTEQP